MVEISTKHMPKLPVFLPFLSNIPFKKSPRFTGSLQPLLEFLTPLRVRDPSERSPLLPIARAPSCPLALGSLLLLLIRSSAPFCCCPWDNSNMPLDLVTALTVVWRKVSTGFPDISTGYGQLGSHWGTDGRPVAMYRDCS
jgi:hypothetical protein